jgi:hypothetical protein
VRACTASSTESRHGVARHAPGCTTGLLRQFAPFTLADGGEGAWGEMDLWYGRKCIEAWRRLAPNLTDDQIIDWSVFTPHDTPTSTT